MKSTINRAQTILKTVCMLIAMLYAGAAFAQPNFISPSNTDNAYALTSGTVGWMNNAELRQGANLGTVVTWDEGAGVVYVKANVNGNPSATISILAPNTGYSGVQHPDVVLGTSLGVVYCGVMYTAVAAVSQIWMDLYTITTGPTTLNFVCKRQISTSNLGVGDGHADLINRVAGLGITRNDFVVAWEDDDYGAPGVAACAGQLSNFCPPNNFTYSGQINTGGVNGAMVDVAGIERFIVGPNVIRNTALFAYVDPANNNTLYYNEWEIPTGAIPGETIQDANVNGLEYPRIDGVDPNTQNANAADANYVITYRYFIPGNPPPPPPSSWQIKQVNNLNAPGGAIVTGYYAPSLVQDFYSPVVACFGLTAIDVAYCTSILIGALSSEVYSEFVNKTGVGAGDVLPAPTTPDVYIVNLTKNTAGPCAPAALSCAYSVVAGNVTPDDEFICWINPTVSGGPILCKACTGGTPAYKSAGLTEIVTNNSWTVKPNPTGGILILQNGQQDDAEYIIADMLGRPVKMGSLQKDNQLDVSQLAKGMYVLSIYNKDKSNQEVKFIKE